jgi:hypothetical protein
MARVDLSSTTDRAPGARPAPTFSTVEAAHTCLIERLSRSKPHLSDSHNPIRRGFLAALSAGAASEHLSTNLIVQLGLATKDLAPFAVRGLFAPRRPWLTEPNTGTSAIFVDKLNPSRLKRFLQHFTRFIGYVRPECTFDALNGWERKPGSRREVGLRPSQKPTRSTELFDRDHARFPLIPFGSRYVILFRS